MRSLPAALQDKLESGVTTLCWCWRVTRRDGQAFGFTSHDAPLSFDGLTYSPNAAFNAEDTPVELGFAVDASEAFGALDDEVITEADLDAGVWDEAEAELFRVDWTDTDDRYAVWTGVFGQIRRGQYRFEAELRSRAHRLTQSVGRVFTRTCDADIGDARCGVSFTPGVLMGSGAVLEVQNARTLIVSGLESFEDGWFTQGRLTWASGAHAGQSFEVERHFGTIITLRRAMPALAEPDDAFSVTAGCDKRFSTCKAKFANAVNFRGFPYMPGNDVLTAGPRSDEESDGGSRGLDG